MFDPFQVVGKSCKPIPVMLLGVLIGRKRYPILKYFFVFLIVLGVAMFMYKDKAVKTPEEGDKAKADEIFDIWSYIGIGELLLLLSLTCDGLTGAVQVNFSCSVRLSNMQNRQVYLTEQGS